MSEFIANLLLEVDVWRVSVEADTHGLQLASQDVAVLIVLLPRSVQHHQNQICRMRHADYLAATPAPRCSAFDDSGQIEHLDLCIVDDQVSGNAGQGGEFVRSRFGLGVRHLLITTIK